MYFWKSLSRETSAQDEKVRLVTGNDLKITQVELLSFLIFKSVQCSYALQDTPMPTSSSFILGTNYL